MFPSRLAWQFVPVCTENFLEGAETWLSSQDVIF